MLNILPQFILGSHKTYEMLPPLKLENLSSVTFLDDKLFPIYIVRISLGEMVFGSQISYAKNSTMVMSERIYLLSIPELPNYLKINEKSCIESLSSIFFEGEAFLISAIPATSESYRRVPLWVFDGAHRYRY